MSTRRAIANPITLAGVAGQPSPGSPSPAPACWARRFSTKPGSAPFYTLSLATAGTWLIGGLQLGSGHLGWEQAAPDGFRAVAAPIATGVAAFGIFYGAARIAQRIPVLNEAISSVLRYAQKGSDPLVILTALANGVGEEVFFRGALFAAIEAATPSWPPPLFTHLPQPPRATRR